MSRELDNVYKPDEWWVTRSISELITPIEGTESYRYDPEVINRQGARTVYSILLGEHKYAPKEGQSRTRELYMNEHPFTTAEAFANKMVILYGSIGISGSIGAWIKAIAWQMLDYIFAKHGPADSRSPVQTFIVYGFTESMSGGHELGEMIVVEAVGEADCHLVSGINNYSGESTAAWSELWTVLKHWSLLFGIPIIYRKLPESVYKAFSNEVQKLEEREAAEADEGID